VNRRDPIASLEEIQRDKFEAMYAIGLLLSGLAERHGICHTVVAKAVGDDVEDMLCVVFSELQQELELERGEAPAID